jgi:hypothetical protein
MRKKDVTGKKYSRLLVISRASDVKNKAAWNCLCDCGVTKIVKLDSLTSGSTKSCGCLNDDQRSARAKNMYSVRIKYKSPMDALIASVFRRRYNDGDLTLEDFSKIISQNCFYCNAIPSNIYFNDDKKAANYNKDGLIYSGLDRINNTLPHNKNNVVPCCKYCNYSKRDRSVEDFTSWIINLHNHFIKKDE